MPESDITITAKFEKATEAVLKAEKVVVAGEEYKVTYGLKDVKGVYARHSANF